MSSPGAVEATEPRGVAHWWPPPFVLALIALVQVIGTFGASRGQDTARDIDALAIALLLAGPAVLFVARRRPLVALGVILAITTVYVARGYPMGPVVISPVVALIRAVLSGRRRAAAIVAGAGVAALIAAHQVAGDHSDAGIASGFAVVAWVVIVILIADLTRTRMLRRQAAAEARAEQRRREQSEERLMIAQELHDVLAHNISLINVQAGVGLHLLDSDPQQAAASLRAIKQVSKDTLGELRGVLDLLRGDGSAPRSPAGGLADVDTLVGRLRSADLDVRLVRTGEVRPVPPAVDLAAFRIVQEALTNVVRHASSASYAQVRVDYEPDRLVVLVDDDGREPVVASTTGGNGLPGMRERSAALDGEFEAGPRPGGGFRVRAALPTGVPG